MKIFEIPIRQFYSIYENLKNAVDSFDYMLILNSGSWLFDGNSVNKILAKLHDFTIGWRAMKYSNMKRLSCDDHFVFINLKNLKKKIFYKIISIAFYLLILNTEVFTHC